MPDTHDFLIFFLATGLDRHDMEQHIRISLSGGLNAIEKRLHYNTWRSRGPGGVNWDQRRGRHRDPPFPQSRCTVRNGVGFELCGRMMETGSDWFGETGRRSAVSADTD